MTHYVVPKTWIVAFLFFLPTVLSQPDVRGAQRAFETFLQSQPNRHQRGQHQSRTFQDDVEESVAHQRFRGRDYPSRPPNYRPQGERFYEDTTPRFPRYSLDNDLPYDAGSTPKYTRGWKAARNEDRDRRPVRQRTTGAHKDSVFIQSKKGNVVTEIKRNPKIVKYIADKNGFAVREDLVQPLQQTIERTRLESRPRIVTAPRTPLSQVVSSAIRVTGGQEGGKFRPKVIDMKVGDQTVGFHKMQYTLGEVKKGYL